MAAKATAELNKRGERFSSELDFVLANVIMALVADFCLVWLPAPTVSFRYLTWVLVPQSPKQTMAPKPACEILSIIVWTKQSCA